MQYYTTRCGLQLSYRLTRSQRRSIGLYLKPHGLEIRAPRRLGLSRIEQALEEKSQWLRKHLPELEQRQQGWLPAEQVWRIGGRFPYLGRMIELQEGAGRQLQALQDEYGSLHTLLLPAAQPAEEIYQRCKTWLRAQARPLFEQRLQHYAHEAGLHYRRLTLGWSKRVWGWCKNDGSIMLNWQLIHYPGWLIDYVIAHELTHLVHMHHGPEFWERLKIIYPDYLSAKTTLQRYHPSCVPNFLSEE
ncbi:MAG TPA: SprT family zinc-dependent metalloprotease [Paenalcaligenes sp.]|nr:SprT family zinc-dependent metalloprotease [Paenalcaligenes sp.]